MRHACNDKGFTLIEIIISVSVTLVVVLGIYNIYYKFTRATSCSQLMVGAQQKARVAAEMMFRDIVLTGFSVPNTFPGTKDILPSIEVAKDNEITFRFVDPNFPGGDKKRMVVTYKAESSPKTPIVKTECEADEDWEVVEPCKTANYIDSLNPSAAGGGLFFEYFNLDGAQVTPESEATQEDKEKALDSIRYVSVAVSVRTEKECLRVDDTVGFDSVSLKTRVRLRNKMGMTRP